MQVQTPRISLVNAKLFPNGTCMTTNFLSQCTHPHISLQSTSRHENNDIPWQPNTSNFIFLSICILLTLVLEGESSLAMPNYKRTPTSQHRNKHKYERSSSTEVQPSLNIFGRTRYPKCGSSVVVWYINSESTINPL
jgi:hypothetical protein